MNTKQLRQKILDLAIRGKLVPQDPSDEPASVLLERVRAEKERLVKEGKIKGDKGGAGIFMGDDRFYYGNLPKGWEIYRLGDCWELLSGRDLTPSEYFDKPRGVPYITGASNFENGNLVINRWTPTPKVTAVMGDLLITCKGTVGEMHICHQAKCHIARQIMAIRNRFDFNIDFLHYSLQYHLLKITDAARGIIPGISREDLLDLMLPLPPLFEQQRIVVIIESAFAIIDEIKRNKIDLQAAITATKSKILSLAIRGKLVPQDPNDEPASVLLDHIRAERGTCVKSGKIKRGKGESAAITSTDNFYYLNYKNKSFELTDEWLYEIPSSWAICCLEQISYTIPSKPFQILQSEITNAGIMPVISQGAEFIEGYSDAITKSYKCKSPIILFGDHTRNVKYVDFDFVVGADGVKIIHPITVFEKFLYYSVLYASEEISKRGYSRHFQFLAQQPLPLPPLAEEYRIVTAIETAFEQLDYIAATLA